MKYIYRFKKIGFSILLICGSLLSSAAIAETAVVVHPSNNVEISEKEVQRLFLGKLKSFPGGNEAIPVDQDKGAAAREAFFSSVLGKNEQQIKAYWSRLIFTGKGTPPKTVGDSNSVKDIVSKNPNTIGYIDGGLVDDSVKVIHSF